jgi:phosphoglycolate phosphatase-like HAD superfamily hydrolase
MLTIVWDVDDVLNDLTYQWFTYNWLVEHPDCQLDYSALTGNPPHRILGTTLEEYLASLDAFRITERALNMKPNPVILAWFQHNGQRFRHIALTARPLETAPDVAHWVMRNFGAWIRCFAVVPTRTGADVPIYDLDKGEFLKWLGRGDILVDDSDENVGHAESLGMRTLLYRQPWNNSTLTTDALLQGLCGMAEEC